MKRTLQFVAFFFIILISFPNLAQVTTHRPARKGAIRVQDHLQICKYSDEVRVARVPNKNPKFEKLRQLYLQDPEAARSFQDNLKTSEIIVNFGPGMQADAAARNAFQFSADLWELELISSVPIVINVDYAPLTGGTIASTGTPQYINVPNAPDPTIAYASSLADAIAGVDLAPGSSDMNMTFNSNQDFYFGFDLNPPSNEFDFVTITFHEIGHGMGIFGNDGANCAGVGLNQGQNPNLWDVLSVDGNGVPVLDLGFGTDAQRSALTGNDLFMSGANAVASLEGSGQPAKIFVPDPCNSGSTFSHWDENTFTQGDPNSLMSPFANTGEAIHDIGDLTRGYLRDIGWRLAVDAFFDIGVANIVSPVSGEGLTNAEEVTIRIGNLGRETLDAVIASYRVDGGPWISQTFVGELAPEQERDFTFAETIDLSAPGEYVIEAQVDYFIDEFPENNIATRTVVSGEVVIPDGIDEFPYAESWESGPGNWESSTLWELGEPAAPIINAASDGANAWVTNLTGNHPDVTVASLTSPIFDFEGFLDPTIEFDIWYDIETGWDGFSFQVSTDNGENWTTVGQFGDPDNWYNDGAANPNLPGNVNGVDALDAAIGNPEGWTGEGAVFGTNGYVRAKHDVDVGGVNGVRFRFLFASDQAVNFEGAAVDNLEVKTDIARDVDVAILEVTSPISGNLTAAETVTATIRNQGIADASNFDISYTIDGGAAVTETITSTIAPGAELSYSFTQTADLSAIQSYDVRVYTSLSGDENPDNNDVTVQVVNEFTVSTFPYLEDFESGAGSWLTNGNNNTWERATPSGAVINGASDGSFAFVTNATGDYSLAETSFLESPGYDFTGVSSPTIGFDIWFETIEGVDAVTLQYSTDNGLTWNITGEADQFVNWFFDLSGSAQVLTGFSGGWTGSSGAYWTTYYELPDLGGESLVKFRFAFVAANNVVGGSETDEGIAVDRIRIFDGSTSELSITCAGDIIQSNDPGLATATVTVANPTVGGNPPGAIFHNDFNYTNDATGSYSLGATVVNFVVDVDGVLAICTTDITVNDDEDPTIVCPDDINIALGSGETEVVVEYPLPAVSDNFGFARRVTYQNTQIVLGGNDIGCPSGPSSFFRPFELEEDFGITNDFTVTSVDIGIKSTDVTSGTGRVNLYIADKAVFEADPDNVFAVMELLATTTQTLEADLLRDIVTIPINTTIPAGNVVILEYNIDLGNADGFFPGYNDDTSGGDSYISCGGGFPDNVENQGFAELQWVMNINGVNDEGGTPELTAGLGSGGSFPLGNSVETYRILDASGNEASCSFNVNVVSASLDAPVATDETAVSNTGFTANWGAVGGITFYEFFLREDLTNEPVVGFDGLITDQTQVVVTGLDPNTAYVYTVRSLDSDTPTQFSVQSNEITASTTIATPTGLVTDNLTSNSVEVEWSRVPGIVIYAVDVSTDNFVTFEGIYNGFLVDNNQLDVTDLTSSTNYQLRVRAVNNGGESANSSVVNFITLPDAPFAQSAANVTASEFTASWTSDPGAVNYLLDVSRDNFATFEIEDLALNTTSYLVTGLDANTSYKYRVRIENAGGLISPNSNLIRTTTLAEAPVAILPTEFSSYGFVAQWNASTNSTNYFLDVSTDGNFGSFILGFNNRDVTGTSALVLGLDPNVEYFYRVRATNEAGIVSGNSNVISFTTPNNTGDVPPTPVAGAAQDVTSRDFLANWTGSNALYFELEVSEDNFATNLSLYNRRRVFGSELDVVGLNDDQDYQYRVRAFNNDGFSDLSNVVDVRTVLGIEDLAELEGVTVFPNPSVDLFTISIDNRIFGEYELIIYDRIGRKITQENFTKSASLMAREVNLINLPSGVYYVTVQTDKAAEVLRLIKE